jgi:hypothetical protein
MLVAKNSFKNWGVVAAGVSIIIVIAGAASQVRGQQSEQAGSAAPARLDYNWDVRPILSDNCFRCHGPDSKSRQAGLRLDQKEAAYARAITPGKPEESELFRRITSPDPSYRMPPSYSAPKSLPAADIKTLTEWIRQGAEYKPHWAFISPTKTPPPASHLAQTNLSPIDAFIVARLEKEGLTPAKEADKETLINRVTLTLTGLPPTLAEIDAFLADKSPNAYEKVVDRLLASPQYGENMAGYWANIARYSESDGFLDDHHDRLFWPYRDWVISAFNKNMPFNQFGTWQIAGDLLPNPTKEQRLATAFLRLGKRTTENGAIDEEYRVEYALERANLIGGGFLAMTTGCARCHDHKYDPIAQKDYYSLSGFFNSADEPGFHPPGHSTVQAGPTLPWTDPETDKKIDDARAKIRAAEAAYNSARSAARAAALAKIGAWPKRPAGEVASDVQKSIDTATVAYYPFESSAPVANADLPASYPALPHPQGLVSPFQREKYFRPDPSTRKPNGEPVAMLNGLNKEKLTASPSPIAGVPPAFLEEANLKPGKIGNAMWFTATNRGVLGRYVGYYDRTQPFSFDLWVYPAAEYEDSQVINHRDDDNAGGGGYKLNLEKNRLSFYMIHSAPFNMLHVISRESIPAQQWAHIAMTYDGSSRAAGITLYANGKPVEVETERDHLTESSLPRVVYPGPNNQFSGIEFGRRFREVTLKDGALDEIRIFNRALTPMEIAFLHEKSEALAGAQEAISAKAAELLAVNDTRVVEAAKALHDAREEENQIVSWQPEVLVMADAPKPRQTYVLSRGLYNVRLDPVDPAPLTQIFAFDPKLPRNRIGLTQWLFDPKNPLVARVFVNRMWQMQFGTGIVETADDFGMQGSAPSHPELLDWLAVDFMESGWDVKRLNKMLVMSSTYRQASEANPVLLKKDQRNRLLARGPRLRMSAEQIRDNALAVSGLLVKKIGGPSAYPYQAEGVWVPGVTLYDYPKPEQVPADDQHRRSLYSFVKRNSPPPSMAVFDFSERHETIARRLTSNTPLQALVLMDDPQYVEAFRVLATNVLKEKTEKDDQIKLVFRLATRRMPKTAELAALRTYYDTQLAHFATNRKKAEDLVHIGVAQVDVTVDPVKMAALTNVTAAVMNTPDAYSIR